MTQNDIPTASIVKAFEGIGINPQELAALALGVDFSLEVVPEDQSELLRDSWARCQRGENRIQAFWWVNGVGRKVDEQSL